MRFNGQRGLEGHQRAEGAGVEPPQGQQGISNREGDEDLNGEETQKEP